MAAADSSTNYNDGAAAAQAPITHVLRLLERGRDLDGAQAGELARHMLDGMADDFETARVLGMLALKGETDAELGALLDEIAKRSLRIDAPAGLIAIDVCGTGGDMQQTFNISTAAAFITAAASRRCAVAKHGNHSSSGASGSADIFAAIGHDNGAEPARVQEILQKNRICFIFAQKFHPAMKHVAAARRMLKPRRTAFNILGPLANPASVKRQLVGVSSRDMLWRIPRILAGRGSKAVMSVMSAEGMDELSTSSSNAAVLMTSGGRSGAHTKEMIIKPEGLGLARCDISELKVAGAAESARAVVGAIDGRAARAVVETAILNAAGALLVAGESDDMGHAVETCRDAVTGGRASEVLDAFAADAASSEMLEDVRNGP